MLSDMTQVGSEALNENKTAAASNFPQKFIAPIGRTSFETNVYKASEKVVTQFFHEFIKFSSKH